MAFQKILVPLDGSSLAERSLPYAKAIAAKKSGEIVIVTVATSEMRLDRPVNAYLEIKAKELQSEGAKASTAVIYGDAADQIVDFADKNKIDLIIQSAHGYSGTKRWAMGNVARKVLHATSIPVLMVKTKAAEVSEAEFRKILLSLDGSAFSEAAMPYVEELVKGSAAEVVLVMVGEPVRFMVPSVEALETTWVSQRNVLERGIQQQVSGYLANVKANFEGNGIKTRAKALWGRPAEEIIKVAESESVDLIVMTTHGRSGISRWVHGSVTSRVVEESSVPVLAVRPSPPEGR